MTSVLTPLSKAAIDHMRTHGKVVVNLQPSFPDAPNAEDQKTVQQVALGVFKHPFKSMEFFCNNPDPDSIGFSDGLKLHFQDQLNSSEIARIIRLFEKKFRFGCLVYSKQSNLPSLIVAPIYEISRVIETLAEDKALSSMTFPFFSDNPPPLTKQTLHDMNKELQAHWPASGQLRRKN